jgi:Ca-activated chloride channel family protein
VRIEEWLNYFGDKIPTDPEAVFSVDAEGGPSPYGTGLELLKITVKARELRPGERKSAVLTFAVDTSGSMATPADLKAAQAQGISRASSRLTLVRQALRTLVRALAPEDRVAVVAYSTHPYLVLPHTPAREQSRILGAIDSLEPTGATNVEAGLDLAYRVADEVFEPKALNRVVLCSDGVANLGARGPQEILGKVSVFARRGIYLSCVGFGMGRYNDKMLETLANNGNGRYDYVDTPKKAEKFFRENLPATLEVLAQDAKIQVDFNPEVVSHYRLLGYENRDIRDEDFRNDKVDAGEVGPGTTVTVLYEIRRRANPRGDLGRIYLRYRDTETQRVDEVNYPLSPGRLATELSQTSETFRFLASVAETAELLRRSYWSRDGSYGKVLQVLGTLPEQFRSRAEYAEFVEIVLRAQALTIQKLASSATTDTGL